MNNAERRSNPPWWDHQRHPLVALRTGVDAILRERTQGAPGERVFDIGCGDRPYEPLVRARGYQYVGCDIVGSPDLAIQLGQPIDARAGSAAGVVSFQVLEHVWDLDWYLGECRRLLAPGGWLLLSTHGVWPYHPHPTDYRRWTHAGLRRELESRGFDVVEMRGLVGPLAWTTQIRALGLRHVLMAIPIVRAFGPALSFVMNVRMAAEEFVTPESIRYENASIYVVYCQRREGTAAS